MSEDILNEEAVEMARQMGKAIERAGVDFKDKSKEEILQMALNVQKITSAGERIYLANELAKYIIGEISRNDGTPVDSRAVMSAGSKIRHVIKDNFTPEYVQDSWAFLKEKRS